MLPITKQISAYNHSAPNNIEYIVIHDVGRDSSAKVNADYFCAANRGASAHYFVDDKSIYQVVEDFMGAWHCGDGRGIYGITNHNSLSVEMCRTGGTVIDITEANTVEIVKYLMAKFNIDINHVVRHYDASRKNCPSAFSANNWARWTSFKAKLSGAPVQNVVLTAAPAPTQSNTNQGGFRDMNIQYKNGSTPEICYADSNLTVKVGSLNPWETCTQIGVQDGKPIVLYNTAAGKKVAFVKYNPNKTY